MMTLPVKKNELLALSESLLNQGLRNLIPLGGNLKADLSDCKEPLYKVLPRVPRKQKDGEIKMVVSWNALVEQGPTTIEQVRYWLDCGATGIGAVCGGAFMLYVFDIDVERFAGKWMTDEVLDILVRNKVAFQISGGGGYQIYARVEDTPKAKKLAWIKDETSKSGRSIAIETRGEGNYIVLPFSLHPSGNHYEPNPVFDGSFGAIPIISKGERETLEGQAKGTCECPNSLQDIEREKRRRQRKATRAKHKKARNFEKREGPSVIDRYNSETDIEDVLGDIDCYSQLPSGRWAYDGGSGSIVVNANNTSSHYSTNDPASDGKAKTPFNLRCLHDFDDDVREAVKAIACELNMDYASQREEERRQKAIKAKVAQSAGAKFAPEAPEGAPEAPEAPEGAKFAPEAPEAPEGAQKAPEAPEAPAPEAPEGTPTAPEGAPYRAAVTSGTMPDGVANAPSPRAAGAPFLHDAPPNGFDLADMGIDPASHGPTVGSREPIWAPEGAAGAPFGDQDRGAASYREDGIRERPLEALKELPKEWQNGYEAFNWDVFKAEVISQFDMAKYVSENFDESEPIRIDVSRNVFYHQALKLGGGPFQIVCLKLFGHTNTFKEWGQVLRAAAEFAEVKWPDFRRKGCTLFDVLAHAFKESREFYIIELDEGEYISNKLNYNDLPKGVPIHIIANCGGGKTYAADFVTVKSFYTPMSRQAISFGNAANKRGAKSEVVVEGRAHSGAESIFGTYDAAKKEIELLKDEALGMSLSDRTCFVDEVQHVCHDGYRKRSALLPLLNVVSKYQQQCGRTITLSGTPSPAYPYTLSYKDSIVIYVTRKNQKTRNLWLFKESDPVEAITELIKRGYTHVNHSLDNKDKCEATARALNEKSIKAHALHADNSKEDFHKEYTGKAVDPCPIHTNEEQEQAPPCPVHSSENEKPKKKKLCPTCSYTKRMNMDWSEEKADKVRIQKKFCRCKDDVDMSLCTCKPKDTRVCTCAQDPEGRWGKEVKAYVTTRATVDGFSVKIGDVTGAKLAEVFDKTLLYGSQMIEQRSQRVRNCVADVFVGMDGDALANVGKGGHYDFYYELNRRMKDAKILVETAKVLKLSKIETVMGDGRTPSDEIEAIANAYVLKFFKGMVTFDDLGNPVVDEMSVIQAVTDEWIRVTHDTPDIMLNELSAYGSFVSGSCRSNRPASGRTRARNSHQATQK